MSWVGLFIILAAAQVPTASFRLAAGWFGAAVVGMAAMWAIWRFFDWGNDYYIITDQRIVWLERTIGLYDSRQEAPLVAIKSGETKSSVVGRLLGFGDVITETFMGQVFFRHIGDPVGIKNLIDRDHKLAIEQQNFTDINTIEGKSFGEYSHTSSRIRRCFQARDSTRSRKVEPLAVTTDALPDAP
jgi:hypothetical protein